MRRTCTTYLVVIWALAQSGGPKIYVGPLVREGFADIDTGIRDSIRDIGQEVRTSTHSQMRPSR